MKTYKEMVAELEAEGAPTTDAQAAAEAAFNNNQLACDKCGKKVAKYTSSSYFKYWCEDCRPETI